MGTLIGKSEPGSVHPSVSDNSVSHRYHNPVLGLRFFLPRGVQVGAKDSVILREYTATPNPLIINEMRRKPGDNDTAANLIDFEYCERSR
jgi:hypothetical protein